MLPAEWTFPSARRLCHW